MDWKKLFTKNKLFNLTKNFELYPIVTIVSAVIGGVAAATIYSTYKLDVQFNRTGPPHTETMIDLLNPRSKKLLTFNQEYKPMTELHSILTEMKVAEKELEEEKAREAAREAMEAAMEDREAGNGSCSE